SSQQCSISTRTATCARWSIKSFPWQRLPRPTTAWKRPDNLARSCWVCTNLSVLTKVLARLLFRRFVGEVAAFVPLYSDIGRGQQWAQSCCEYRVCLQGIQGGVQAGREPRNAALGTLDITQI